MSESVFDSIFGKGGTFEAIFGRGGSLDAAFKDGKKVFSGTAREALERDRYNEALMTELLTTLAGKKIITNAEAREMIARAKERVKRKSEEDKKSKSSESKSEEVDDGPCGGTCPLHDKRPHKNLNCKRCERIEPHLIDPDGTARCRVCLTARYAT